MKKRDAYFDVVKFVAMFMVVFGHVQSATEMSWGTPYIKNFIIQSNMPLFFIISGYFAVSAVQGGGGDFVEMFGLSLACAYRELWLWGRKALCNKRFNECNELA